MTGSHVTGSHVTGSHMTGSHVTESHVTRSKNGIAEVITCQLPKGEATGLCVNLLSEMYVKLSSSLMGCITIIVQQYDQGASK